MTKITIIESTYDWMVAMKKQREDLGMTLDDLDYRAGVPDRYASKVEAGLLPDLSPKRKAKSWRRSPVNIQPNATFLMEALGFRLVLMPIDLADAIAHRPKDGKKPRPHRFFSDLMVPHEIAKPRSIHHRINAKAGFVPMVSRIHPIGKRLIEETDKVIAGPHWRSLNRHQKRHLDHRRAGGVDSMVIQLKRIKTEKAPLRLVHK
ncbi:MAG: hypothetical protein ACX94B_13065 [Henriciella sp.]